MKEWWLRHVCAAGVMAGGSSCCAVLGWRGVACGYDDIDDMDVWHWVVGGWVGGWVGAAASDSVLLPP